MGGRVWLGGEGGGRRRREAEAHLRRQNSSVTRQILSRVSGLHDCARARARARPSARTHTARRAGGLAASMQAGRQARVWRRNLRVVDNLPVRPRAAAAAAAKAVLVRDGVEGGAGHVRDVCLDEALEDPHPRPPDPRRRTDVTPRPLPRSAPAPEVSWTSSVTPAHPRARALSRVRACWHTIRRNAQRQRRFPTAPDAYVPPPYPPPRRAAACPAPVRAFAYTAT